MRSKKTAAKNLMAATWTKAAKVRRAFKAGKKRQKDFVLTPRRAVLEAYSVLHELRAAMSGAGLAETDANAALVFVNAQPSEDRVYIARMPEPERLPEVYGKARKMEAEGDWKPLGLLLHQIDHEAANPAYLWAQQWLMDARSGRALLAARNIVAGGGGGEHPFN